MAQAENTEMLKREPYIDLVIGPQSYHKLNKTVLQFQKNRLKSEITDFDTVEKLAEYLNFLLTIRLENYLKI